MDPKQVDGFLHHSGLPVDEVSRVLDLFLGESRSLPEEVGDAHRHAVDRLLLDSFDQGDLEEHTIRRGG